MSMSCRAMTTVDGCYVVAGQPPMPILIHTEYGEAASGLPIVVATRYTNAANVIVSTAAGVVQPGSCPLVSTDTEFLMLCDTSGPANAPVVTPFLRRIDRVTNTGTAALISQTVTDLQNDGATAYTVVGVVGSCGGGDHEFTEVTVCDSTGTAFIRRQTMLNGNTVTLGFFTMAGVAATPSGAVGACPSCGPATAQGLVSTWG
jgi:hypothetical protein